MTGGGIVQLETYGIEDKPLIANPEITYFKQQHRQHSLFSSQEIENKFKGKPQFGSAADCNIINAGDLLQDLTLCVDLPSISTYYPNTIQEEISQYIKSSNFELSPSHYMYFTERLRELQNTETFKIPLDRNYFVKTYPWLNSDNTLTINEGMPSDNPTYETLWSVPDVSANDQLTQHITSVNYKSQGIDNKQALKRYYYPLNAQYFLHVLQKNNIDDVITNSNQLYAEFIKRIKNYVVRSKEFELVKYIEEQNSLYQRFTDIEYSKNVLVNIGLQLNTKMELEPLLYCYSKTVNSDQTITYQLKSILNRKNITFANNGYTINTEVFSNNYDILKDNINNSVFFIGTKKDIINSLDLQQIANIRYVSNRTVANIVSETSVDWNITYTTDPIKAIEWEIDIAEPLRDVYPSWDVSYNYNIDFNITDNYIGLPSTIIESNINKYLVYVYASSNPEEQDITIKEGLYATNDNQKKYVVDASNNYFQVKSFIIQPTVNLLVRKYVPIIFNDNNSYNVNYNNKYYLDSNGIIKPIYFINNQYFINDNDDNPYVTNYTVISITDYNIAFVIDLYKDNNRNIIINNVLDLSNNYVPVIDLYNNAKYIYRGKYYNYLNMYYINNSTSNLKYPIDGFPYQSPVCVFYVQNIIGNKLYLRKFTPQDVSINDVVLINNNIEIVNTTTNSKNFTIVGNSIFERSEILNYDISSNLYILNGQNITRNNNIQFYWENNYNLIDPNDIIQYISKEYWADDSLPYIFTIKSTNINNCKMIPLTVVELQQVNYDVYNNYIHIFDQLNQREISDESKFNQLVTLSGNVSKYNMEYLKRFINSFLTPDTFLSQYVRTDKTSNIVLQPFFISEHYNDFISNILDTSTNETNLIHTIITDNLRQFTDILDLNFINTVKQISYNKSDVFNVLNQEYIFGIKVSTTLTLASTASIRFAFPLEGYPDISLNNLPVIDLGNNEYYLCIYQISDFLIVLNRFVDRRYNVVVTINNTYIDDWSVVYGEPIPRSNVPLISHPMYSNYIMNDILVHFYHGLVTKIINKFDAIFDPFSNVMSRYFKTHLIEHLWHVIHTNRQILDNAFSKFTSSDQTPNIYAFNDITNLFDAKNLGNMLTNIINKYFQENIRPLCIDFLNGKTINNQHFYLIETDITYRPNYNDVELSTLSHLELLQWVIYEKYQDDNIFINLKYKFIAENSFGDVSGNIMNTIRVFLRSLLIILNGELVSGYTLQFNNITSVNSIVFGSTIILENANVNDIMINYINQTISNYTSEYQYNYILQYFNTFKTEYIKFYSDLLSITHEIGLSSYETFNNIQKIISFEISDYNKQLDYPRINPSYNPDLEFITYESFQTNNPNNYYYCYELNFINKTNKYFDYFISKRQEDINLYFSYKSILDLQNYSESDIINKWKQDFYSSKSLTSSFEFKAALQWFIFERVKFGNIGSFLIEHSQSLIVDDQAGGYHLVPMCIRTSQHTMKSIIKDGYFYDINNYYSLYPKYNILNDQYVILVNNNLVTTSSYIYNTDFSDNSVVDVSNNKYFHIKDQFYSLSHIIYTEDASGNFRDISNNIHLEFVSMNQYDVSNNMFIQINNLFFNKIDYQNNIKNPAYVLQNNVLYKISTLSFEKIRNYYFYNNDIYELSHVPTPINNNQFTDSSNNIFAITLNSVLDVSSNKMFTIVGNVLLNMNDMITYVYGLDKRYLFKIIKKIELLEGEIIYYQVAVNPFSRQIEYHFGNLPDEQWINTSVSNAFPKPTFNPLSVDPSYNLDVNLTFVKDIIYDVFHEKTLHTVAKLNWNLNDVMQNIEYQLPILINLLIKDSLIPPQQSWNQYMMVSMWNNVIKIYNLNASHFINHTPKALEIQNSVSNYNSTVESELRVLYWNVTKQKFGLETFSNTDEIQIVPYIYNYYHSGDVSTNTIIDVLNIISFDMVKHIEHLVSVYAAIPNKNILQQQTHDLNEIKQNFFNLLYNNLPKDLILNTTETIIDPSLNTTRTYVYDNVWKLYNELIEVKNNIPVYITDLPFGFEYDFSDNKIRYTATFDENRMILSMLYHKWNQYLEREYMEDIVNRNLISVPVLPLTSDNYINQRTLRLSENFNDLQNDFLTFIDNNLLQKEAYYGIRQYMKSGEEAYLYAMIIDDNNLIQSNDYIIIRKNNYPFGPLFVDFAYNLDISGSQISSIVNSSRVKILKILKDPIFIFDNTANYSIEGPQKRDNIINTVTNKDFVNIPITNVFKNLFYYYHDFSGNNLSDPLYLIITMLGVQPLIDFIERLQSLPFLVTTANTFNTLLTKPDLLDFILTPDTSGNYTILENVIRFTYILTTPDPSGNLIKAINDDVFQKLIFFIITLEIANSNIFNSISLNTLLPQLFPSITSLTSVFASNPNWINYILDASHNFIDINALVTDPSLNIISLILDPSNNLFDIETIISSYPGIINYVLNNNYININNLLLAYPQLINTFLTNNYININNLLISYPQLISTFLSNNYININNLLLAYPQLINTFLTNNYININNLLLAYPQLINTFLTNNYININNLLITYPELINSFLSNNYININNLLTTYPQLINSFLSNNYININNLIIAYPQLINSFLSNNYININNLLMAYPQLINSFLTNNYININNLLMAYPQLINTFLTNNYININNLLISYPQLITTFLTNNYININNLLMAYPQLINSFLSNNYININNLLISYPQLINSFLSNNYININNLLMTYPQLINSFLSNNYININNLLMTYPQLITTFLSNNYININNLLMAYPQLMNSFLSNNYININNLLMTYPQLINSFLTNNYININNLLMSYPQLITTFLTNNYININNLVLAYPQLITTFLTNNYININNLLLAYPQLVNTFLTNNYININNLVLAYPQLITTFLSNNYINLNSIIGSNPQLVPNFITYGYINPLNLVVSYPLLANYITQNITTEIFTFISTQPQFANSLITNGVLYTNYSDINNTLATDLSNNSMIIYDPSWNGVYTAINNLSPYGLTDVSLNTLLYLIDPSQNTFQYTEFLIGYLFYNGLIQYNTQQVLYEMQVQGLFDDLINSINPLTLTNLLFTALQTNVDPSLNSLLQLLDPSTNILQVIGTIQTDLSLNSLFQLLDPSVNMIQVLSTIQTDLSLNSLLQLLDPSANLLQVLGSIQADLSLNSLLQLLDPSVNLIQVLGSIQTDLSLNSLLQLLDPSVNMLQVLSTIQTDLSLNSLLQLLDPSANILQVLGTIQTDLSLNSLLQLLDPSVNMIQVLGTIQTDLSLNSLLQLLDPSTNLLQVLSTIQTDLSLNSLLLLLDPSTNILQVLSTIQTDLSLNSLFQLVDPSVNLLQVLATIQMDLSLNSLLQLLDPSTNILQVLSTIQTDLSLNSLLQLLDPSVNMIQVLGSIQTDLSLNSLLQLLDPSVNILQVLSTIQTDLSLNSLLQLLDPSVNMIQVLGTIQMDLSLNSLLQLLDPSTNILQVLGTIQTDLSLNSLFQLLDPSVNLLQVIGTIQTDLSLNSLFQLLDPSVNMIQVLGSIQTDLSLNSLLQLLDPSANILQVLGSIQTDLSLNSLLQLLDPSVNMIQVLGTIQMDLSLNSLLQLLDPSVNILQVIGSIQTDLSLNSLLQLLDPSVNIVQVIGSIQTDLSLNSLLQLLDASVNLVNMATNIIGAITDGTITDPSSVLSLLPVGTTPVMFFNLLQQSPDISTNMLFESAFENLDFIGLFGQISGDAVVNPSLVDDLSLNTLLTLLDPSGALIERVITNTYLINYLLEKGFINVFNFVPQFVTAIQNIPELLLKIIPYINFPELQADLSGNAFLLATFNVDVFVGQYFQPLLKYLPSIIEQVEPEDLFIYTDAQAVSKYVTEHPDIITSLIEPDTILTTITENPAALSRLINIPLLVQNLQYNPDLLPLFTDLEQLFEYIIGDPSDNQLVFRLFNNQNFAIFIDNDPTFLTKLLDMDALLLDLSGNSSFGFLFDGSGNPVVELAEITHDFPLFLIFLVKYLDPVKIAELLNTEPDLLFQFININELLLLVQQGIIPFEQLINQDRLIANLQNDTNLIGLLLDINTIKKALETDTSGSVVASLLDRGVLKTFIKTIPIAEIAKIVNEDVFRDPSNNQWLNYFDMEQVTSDPEIRAILPNIVRPEIFTNQIQVFSGIDNVSFLLDPSKNYINFAGLLTEEDVVRVLLDTSGNGFQIFQLLFGALDTITTDISGNINLLYSFISLFDDKSLFGLLANRDLLNTINETILKGLFKALPLANIINSKKEKFSQLLIADISGNTNNLIEISSILDPVVTLNAFRTNQPADILGDFINLITLDTIEYAIRIQRQDPSSNFIESFFTSSLGSGSIGTNFSTSIFQQFSGSNIGFLLQFIEFGNLLRDYLTVFINYISFVDGSGNVNPSLNYVINLSTIFSNPQLFLGDLSGNSLDILLNYLFSIVSPNTILNNPELPSNSYLLGILYVYGETVNGTYIPGILDISNASVFVDPSFNWLPYIKKQQLLQDISNNPQIINYFIDINTVSQDANFIGVLLNIISPQKFLQLLTDPSLNIINLDGITDLSVIGTLFNIQQLIVDITNNLITPSGQTLTEIVFSNFRLGDFLVALSSNPEYNTYLTNAINTIDINSLRADLSSNRITIIEDISEGRISLSDFASLITTSGLQALVSNDPQKVLQYFDLVDINALVQLIENDPRLFLDLLTEDVQLSDIVDFSTLSINSLLQDTSLISGLLSDATSDSSSNLLSAILSNDVMINTLFKNSPIRDGSLNVIPADIIDREFIQTLGYLPDQLKDLSNNPQLDTNVFNFTELLNDKYNTLIPDSLADFATQPIFRPLFLGFTQAFLDISLNQNMFIFTENTAELQILQYITIKDLSSNIIYGPYPIIISEVVNDQKLLKIQIDPSFNSVYDTSTNFIINHYFNSSLAVKNVNNYQWREYYKQSYEVLSLNDNIVPVIENLIAKFQSSKTAIPDRNTVATDLITVSINTDTIKSRINDISGVSISNTNIVSLLNNAEEKLSYFPILFNSYVNLRKIYDNRVSINSMIGYNQSINNLTKVIDTSINQVKTNVNSETGLNKVIEYGNNVHTFVNFANSYVQMIDLINSSIINIDTIASNLSGSTLATFNTQTSSIKNSGLTNTIRQLLVDLSNNPFTGIENASTNSMYINLMNYKTVMNWFDTYYNQYGNLLQLNSQTTLIGNFLSNLSSNVIPTINDISNNVVYQLDNSLNITQTDNFIASLDGYMKWLDIPLTLTSLQNIVRQMRTLEEYVKDPSGNINKIPIYEKKFGLDLSFNIDLFKDPNIPNIIKYILDVEEANNNLTRLVQLMNIRDIGKVFMDVSMNQLLSQALANTTSFFNNLPFVSVYGASLPSLASLINNRPNISSSSYVTSQLYSKFVYFAGLCDWIVNSLLPISTLELKNKLNTIRGIWNVVKNETSGLNNTLQQLLQNPDVQFTVQSLLNKFDSLKSFDIIDISNNITLLDTLEIIKSKNSQLIASESLFNGIAQNLFDVSQNMATFNAVPLVDVSHSPLSLPITSVLGKIQNYNKLIVRWNDIKQLYNGRNDYFAYFQAQLRRLYDIVTIKENLDILDIIGNDDKVKEWLSIGVKANSTFILASDQSDFLRLDDWIVIQNNNENNSAPVIINDLQSIVFRNDKYKILRVVWKNGVQTFNPDNNYTIEGGIGNFLSDINLFHERTFFDTYRNYHEVKDYSRVLLSYVDVYSDYSNVYKVTDYMNYILDDVLSKTPFSVPNAVLSRAYGHGFGNIQFNPDITALDQYNISYNKELLVEQLREIINRPITPTVAWIDYLGHFLASKIELFIDDQPLQTLTSDWLHINHNINTPDGQHRGYDMMIGNTPELTTPRTSIQGSRLYIPLPFYFHKRPSLALPLIAMFNSNLHMKVHLRGIDELIHIPITAKSIVRGDFKMVLLGKYVYLSEVERKLFAESRHEYMIEQIQYRVKDVNTREISDEIYFKNPTKDLFFFYQSDENIRKKQYHNYTFKAKSVSYSLDLLNYEKLKYTLQNIDISESNIIRNTGLQPVTEYGENPFERCLLYLNGHKRFDCEGEQTGLVYPMDRYKKTFAPGLNVYPFCRFPEEGQPSGYCNFTYISDQRLEYRLKEAKDGVVKIFGRSYNMLRVMGGIAGIGF